jgi:hypothetical protein
VAAGQVMSQTPAPYSQLAKGSTIRLVIARAPQWHQVLYRSGTSTYKSPSLNVPKRWRIHYTVRPTGEFGLGSALFSITGAGYDYFSSDGGTDDFYPEAGPGPVQIEVDPTDAAWSFAVEVLD